MADTFAFSNHAPARRRTGFSLVEISVVVVIGSLAVLGVPCLLQSVESGKASEAFSYLVSVQTAQKLYHANHGVYAADISDLDMSQASPAYFDNANAIAAGDSGHLDTSWQLTLTRAGASSGYGSYTVSFTQDGFNAGASNIPTAINPHDT